MYDNQRILITGASAGIGREMARQLAPRAKTLILVARRRERLDALKDELTASHGSLQVLVEPCDLADLSAIDAMVERVEAAIGGVDVLINNAGFGDTGLFERAPAEKLTAIVQVNCVALTHLTHRLLGPMLKAGRGGILNVSSGFGFLWIPGVAVYAATKHYVTSMTEMLRLELRGTGVVVTQSCPGPVATEFESVAGNPTGQSVPKLLEISAERCARDSLRGLEKRRAMVLPGGLICVLMNLGRLVPRWVYRLFYSGVGGWLRKRPQAQ